MPKAFVETTILTDLLLKGNDEPGIRARAALGRFTTSELPVYAIKEFQIGPLKNFAWFHNKLAATGSFSLAVGALRAMAMTPRRYTVSSALEGLQGAVTRTMANVPLGELARKHGASANPDVVLCDEFRLSMKVNILKAWRTRRSVTTAVVQPLACFIEVDLKQERGQILVEGKPCETQECCLAPALRKKETELRALAATIRAQDQKPENTRRSKALRSLYRTPKRTMNPDMCRDLGDAYFALFAPTDSVVLSTNTKDLSPLVAALGKKVERP
jgi:hypothetical protein